MQIEHNQIRFG